MTYARARLWLGISGVGSLVMVAGMALVFGLPHQFLESKPVFRLPEFLQLSAVLALFVLWVAPLDLVGGFLLPSKFNRSGESFGSWLRRYTAAVLGQALFFVVAGSTIVLVSQAYGSLGGFISMSLIMIVGFVARNRWVLSRESQSAATSENLRQAVDFLKTRPICVPRIVVVQHHDMGFTGGVVGFGKNAEIVIPCGWLSLKKEHLATAIARRAMAISTGSYTRGLVLAFVWNVFGFWLCSLLSGAELSSIAGLVTTMCGFTLWSFLGLLTLPTISRNASLKIDQDLSEQGLAIDLVSSTASALDQLQDNEPDRSRWIETIFHPIPCVHGRQRIQPVKGFAAWNVARTSLLLSWACLGFLSRSVHCNVGRPELWTMLPTD